MQAETLTLVGLGTPINEYRMRGRRVEFRSRPQGHTLAEDGWRKLTKNEILLHLRLSTPLAWWLTARREFREVTSNHQRRKASGLAPRP